MSLIPEQKAPIAECFDSKDVFAWLLNGFGKSICYKVLRLDKKFDRDTSFVFLALPFISLMVSQVHSLCVSEGLYALLKDAHRTNVLRQIIV